MHKSNIQAGNIWLGDIHAGDVMPLRQKYRRDNLAQSNRLETMYVNNGIWWVNHVTRACICSVVEQNLKIVNMHIACIIFLYMKLLACFIKQSM
jgi:hypothetical protein